MRYVTNNLSKILLFFVMSISLATAEEFEPGKSVKEAKALIQEIRKEVDKAWGFISDLEDLEDKIENSLVNLRPGDVEKYRKELAQIKDKHHLPPKVKYCDNLIKNLFKGTG